MNRFGMVALITVMLAGCGGSKIEPKWSSLYSNELQGCSSCHAPDAPGRTSDIESSLDFSTASAGYSTVKGRSAGLQGNFSACNGVSFVVPGNPEGSLLVAALDSDTRAAFNVDGCDQDAIADMTIKRGSALDADSLSALKEWIKGGAPID